MNISEQGLALIASFEGFSSTLYNDPAGHCTIGYGFLVHLGNCDGRQSESYYKNSITPEQGRQLLRTLVIPYANAVNNYTSVALTQGQFDALTSFTYNVGPGGYINSSVRRVLNQGRYDLVCGELKKYVYGTNGVRYQGLVNRRVAECQLFNSNIPLALAGGDDMFIRVNGVAGVFTNASYNVGNDYFMALRTDFPSLPTTLKAVELDVRIEKGVGFVVFRDGSKAYADTLNSAKPQAIVKVIPASDGRIFFDVVSAPIKFQLVGIVGYWS